MAQPHHTPGLHRTEEAITPCCVLPPRRRLRTPQPARRALRLAQAPLGLGGPDPRPVPAELRGVESEQSLLREAERFFAHLFPGVVGLWPSSLNRRLRKLRRFLEPLRRAVVSELVGEPETLIVDSTLLSAASLAPAPGQAVGGLRRRCCLGEVGLLERLWGQAAPAVRRQRGAPVSYELSRQRTSRRCA